MKHNHTNRKPQKSGQSSYKRHNKRAYQPSDNYQHWRRCMKEGDQHGARDYARRHSLQFLGWDATDPELRRRRDAQLAEADRVEREQAYRETRAAQRRRT